MIDLSLKKISTITHGKLYGSDLIIRKIVIDTKKITQGCLFIALIGKKFDAHIFIKDAIKKGCSAVLTKKKINYPISHIVVNNTSIAFGEIARWIRNTTNPKILAITGSSGKTSVKEMTASILRKNGNTLSTIKNFNNNIGVPLTLIRLTSQHKYCVIELGASNPGEIAYTSKLTQPKVVLINNIHHAHLSGFKSLLGVAKAKSEIFSGLHKNGIIILNLDSNYLSQWEKDIKNRKIIYFSLMKKKSHFFASNIKLYSDSTSFTMHTPSGKINIYLPFLGHQNISNALAASALAFSMKIPLDKIQSGLFETPQIPNRLQVVKLDFNKILIDDTYNSNVSSMIAAIKVLEKMPNYKILVSGDMAELGKKSILYHQMIGSIANKSNINKILSFGSKSSQISNNYNSNNHFTNKNKLNKYLQNIISKKKKFTVLIKGSRSMKMETIVKYFLKENKRNDILDF